MEDLAAGGQQITIFATQGLVEEVIPLYETLKIAWVTALGARTCHAWILPGARDPATGPQGLSARPIAFAQPC